MSDNKIIHIIGGGTSFHVRPHLALSAPAYGGTAKRLEKLCKERFPKMSTMLWLTAMAGGPAHRDTNDSISQLLDGLVDKSDTKVVFMTAALCDYVGYIIPDDDVSLAMDMNAREAEEALGNGWVPLVGLKAPRLKTSEGRQSMLLRPADKLIGKIRKTRKDIFLVGFKTTTGASSQEMFTAGLHLLKGASCNLVLVNDLHTKKNMIVTPEEAPYHETTDRDEALRELVDMVWHRTHLTFTRSTVVDGTPVPWSDPRVPDSLRTVVNYCIQQGAYKEFRGSTVGHFAVKLPTDPRFGPAEFLTSIRKTNFNELDKVGLVHVKTDGDDSVIAYGAKPSVGGQSQRIVFAEHEDSDCIVHFHCPLKPGSHIPVVSQREFECGSHQCGKNTSTGLARFSVGGDKAGIWVVMLDKHGPNIVFNRNINPQWVINFIEANFDLKGKTGGYIAT